ncbi:YfhO family protein [Aerococcaceae bacterium WGS1372]
MIGVKYVKKVKPYLLNTLLISIFFVAIAIIYEFTPFGKDTMLTVDLGQQYIDFFSLYKDTLLNSPEKFLYSFEKALGGEMIGLWAYYLLSPFNLIFLFFNESNFELAVTLITYLKILAMSLSFMWFSRQKYKLNTVSSLIFSLSYTFMSYVIVYQLNIMWLDGLVLLPIIALGLDYLVTKKSPHLYVISLALLLIANYYIGYMVCLFLAMYAVLVIVENQDKFDFIKLVQSYVRFGIYSISSALIAGIVLIPTFYSLTQNKGSYMNFEWNFEIAHSIQDIFSKIFVGSFNFDEMSSGSPNLYAGMLVLLFSSLFFFNKHIKLSEKLITVGIMLVFICSFSFEVLNKIWHGGQFPIWYHFRFSFTTTFLLIVMAIKAFINQPKIYSLKVLLGSIITMTLFSMYYLWINEYNFLDELNIILSLAFFLVIIIVIQLNQIGTSTRETILLAIVTVELFTNAFIVLSDINYVQQSKFEDYTETLNEGLTDIRHSEDEFYRTNKTFMRTKNEAMYTHYNGMDHFGSTIEAHVPELYGYLGLPDGNGFAVYTNGTLFLDDFFSIKYFLNPSENSAENTDEDGYVLYPEATDLDMAFHPIIKQSNRIDINENEQYFGLGIEVSNDIINPDSQFFAHQPIANQELLLRLIDYNGNQDPYFKQHEFNNITYENIEVTDKGDGDYYTYTDTTTNDNQIAKMIWEFDTESTNPYYFSIPSQYSSKNVSLDLNSNHYRFYSPFRRRQLYNASYGSIQNNQEFEVELIDGDLKANLVELYEFNLDRYESLMESKSENMFEVTSFKHNHIKGNINVEQEKAHILFTIPYDSQWKIKVDGNEVEQASVLSDTLMAIPITQGYHNIELVYFPRSITYGLITSSIGIILLFGLRNYEKNKGKKMVIMHAWNK